MATVFASPKDLEEFNAVRAIVGGRRKKLITQSEMFHEMLAEYREKEGV